MLASAGDFQRDEVQMRKVEAVGGCVCGWCDGDETDR